ncbi:hypothetical protein GPECTOR_1485g669 [Gonium pectorale]|uniref:Uncharacterized protein n=1 Tax=Gonium pectorale TaxID=33097 RepID=A0A150FV35_GONPE|nr:hypothetical protein GPECTOR_1485g669 [Gonium pectorale]|eukprot:KXZ40890.1 hypothetical protein GPECTOR_1485g669 [Gonium pectorale]
MAPNPFPQADAAAAQGAGQDFILVIILLGLMLFFLVRSIGKFSSAGLKASHPCRHPRHYHHSGSRGVSRPKSGKAKEGGDTTEGATTTAGEEEDEEEEEEAEEEEAEGNEGKED